MASLTRGRGLKRGEGPAWRKNPTRGKGIVVVVALLVLAVLVYAWIDGGREPLHDITVPVAVPESAK